MVGIKHSTVKAPYPTPPFRLLADDWNADHTLEDQTIEPAKLKSVDVPADGEAPCYNEAEGKFEWKTAAGVSKHTELTDKEVEGVIDHADLSVTIAKLAADVAALINGALQKSGGTMSGDLELQDLVKLIFDTAKTTGFQYRPAIDCLELLSTNPYISAPAALYLIANTGEDGLGTWEPSLSLRANGEVRLSALAGQLLSLAGGTIELGPGHVLPSSGGEINLGSSMLPWKHLFLAEAPTENLHAATKKYVDDSVPMSGFWKHDGTLVWDNAPAPTEWTDMDLSAYVGANRALVLLKVLEWPETEGDFIQFKTKGETYSNNVSGPSSVFLESTYMSYIIVETDENGMVEWQSSEGNWKKVWLLGYVK